MSWDREHTIFRVVVNHEEQYSIWPDSLDIPHGWREVGVSGPKPHCLHHIEQVWTDMRPLSSRRHMEGLAHASDPPGAAGSEPTPPEEVA